MLELMWSIIPTVVVLGILIFVHELGHFLVAKKSGVKVEKFSIGFGPVIAKVTKGDTEYALSLIPFGGFVKMAGETYEDREGEDIQPSDFLAQSTFKRFLIILAGPVMNYVSAIILFFMIFFVFGNPHVEPVVGSFSEEFHVAEQAGLEIGDYIVSINDIEISDFSDVPPAIVFSNEDNLHVIVVRNGEEHIVDIALQRTAQGNVIRKIGIKPNDTILYVRYGFFDSIGKSFQTTGAITKLTGMSLYWLVRGKLSLNAVSGPIGIMQLAKRSAKRGLVPILQLMALLSVSLAFFNVLPIPALDGGHLFFILIEAIRRKPVSFHMQERFAQVGFLLLMLLMVVITWSDISKIGVISRIKDFFVG